MQYVSVLAAVVGFGLNLVNQAESQTFEGPSRLNIECECFFRGDKIGEWHHVVEVPKRGLVLNLSQVCRQTSNNHSGGDACPISSDFRGRVHAIDSAETD